METSKPLQQQAYEHLKGLIYQDFFLMIRFIQKPK